MVERQGQQIARIVDVAAGQVQAPCQFVVVVHFQAQAADATTASALVACSFVFSLLVLPLAWLAGPHVDSGTPLTPGQVMLGWATLALIVWSLSVNAHIMRRAMDSSFVFGFALVTSWAIADWALGHALFDVR